MPLRMLFLPNRWRMVSMHWSSLSAFSIFSMNVRRMRCRQVGAYLHWLSLHGITAQDFSVLLPDFKKTPAKLPQTWTEEEIDRILKVIDTESPTGKRNYAMFLLMARTGLRVSDIVSLKSPVLGISVTGLSLLWNLATTVFPS